MSQPLISRSLDLKRLRDEGYDIEIRAGHLLVKQVPYVNAQKEVRLGVLVLGLTVDGEVAAKPADHVAMFAGEHPCHKDGSKIHQIENASARREIDSTLTIDHTFSAKPQVPYADFYEKTINYVHIISDPAQAIDSNATTRVYPVIATAADESVFQYLDTAASRAGITAATAKLERHKVAIVGVGGTGSYVLDFVAKTPVREIHIFDGDRFSNHNAFRSPGAAALGQLAARPQKVNYLAEVYSHMHRHIVPHDCYVDGSNLDLLADMTSVFICLDKGSPKTAIVESLESRGVPFVDVGMGIELDDNQELGGILRVTASTASMRDHVRAKNRISFFDTGDDDYDRNIQVADLNGLNAALAVIKWKKIFGFYRDLEREHFTTYTVDGNHVLNEDTL